MGRPKTYDRDDVLKKSMGLFWTKGYVGTRLAELLEVTGINRFSLYKEFGGKEGLFREALENYLNGLQEIESLLSRQPLGLDNIRDFFAAMFEKGFRHGCFAFNTIREKHVVPPEIFKRVEAFAIDVERSYLVNLEAAQKHGDLGASTNLESLARFLTAFDMGLLTYGIVTEDTKDKGTILELLDRVLQ